MIEEKVIKEFRKGNVFFNNGLVNLKLYLEENKISWINCVLTADKLEIIFPKAKEEESYRELFSGFINNNEIVYMTENDRLYWDKDNETFAYSKKYDIKGKSSGNDVKYSYKYISPEELGLTTKELHDKYMSYAKDNKLSEKKISIDTKIFMKGNTYKKNSACRIPIIMTKAEAIDNYMSYLVSKNNLDMDSKIHQFEDGGFCFKDMIDKKNIKINKWDALIYWFGVKIKRYYNSSYFIYLNSIDLLALYEIKKHLDISDEPLTIKDKKTNQIKNLPTNLKLSKQLEYDGIQNKNFYITNSEKEFELKFMMYLCSFIYHIEKNYKNTDKERIKRKKEKLYKSLEKISIFTYTEDDSNMKSSLEEYTKMHRMIVFMTKLINSQYKETTLFNYYSQLLSSISISKDDFEKVNLNTKSFADKMLKFINLRKIYYEVSFKLLKNNKGKLGLGLFEFEKVYLKEIGRGDIIMNLHENCKVIGNGIGVFVANLKDRDLLFKLRNVKNHKQLVKYFKELKFTILKKESEAKFSKEFIATLHELLTVMEEDNESWELIRDYIAIYAIDKYKSVDYKQRIEKGGK